MSHINKKLLPLKLLLFFLYAAIGCLMPYLTIHMYHIGLSHEEITWINTVLPITALIGPTLGGYLADRSGNYRLIIISSMVLAAIFHTALLFVPERIPTTKPILQMVCGPQGSALVLQSCTGQCPQVNSQTQSTYKFINCRKVCDVAGKSCHSLSSSRLNSSFLPVEREISVHQPAPLPKLCLHYNQKPLNQSSNCQNFTTNTFMEFSSNVAADSSLQESSEKQFFSGFQDCCEYPVQNFSTQAYSYAHLTCSSSPNCFVLCDVTETSNASSSSLQSHECFAEGDQPKVTFWMYFGLRAIAEMFPAILISLFDAVVLTMVTKHGGDYGRQKMFGLFAIGGSAPLVGYLMDKRIGVYGKYLYGPVFYVFDALLLLTCIITLTLPLKVEVQRSSMLKNLSQLIRTYELNLLFVVVILLGLLYGYLEIFLYRHLADNLNASKLLLGFTITVGIVPSVPFLYKSDLIVQYCGHHYLLILAFVGYCIRFAGLSYMKNPYWVIPIEVLELFTLNLMQVASATLAFKLAPKTLVATAQSLVWLAHFDIGRALGTVIGGYLIQLYGMITVFQVASVFSAVCAIVYLFFYQLFKYLKAKRASRSRVEPPKANGTVMSNGSNYMPLPVTNQSC